MSNYPLELSQEERIDLKEKLQLIAQWYFTGEVLVSTSCGICNALCTAFDEDSTYYTRMDSLLWEFQRSMSLGSYTDSYEEWEGRAYMCLILAEYLDTTIDLKSSEILRKARVLLPDGSYKYHATQSAFLLFEKQQIEIESLKAQVNTGAKLSRLVTLTCAQLREALMFGAPDNDDQEQLETEMVITWAEDGHSGKGYYCYYSELPEEGAIFLDEMIEAQEQNQ